MTVTRKNIEFTKRVGYDRVGNDYEYGGNWDPFNLKTGTDCSGVVIDICDGAINGTAMAWTRHGMSTESWRPTNIGAAGPFGTIRVASPNDFPADASVKIAMHHGPGGGANSHTWCEIDGVRFESHGSTQQYPNGRCVTGSEARDVYDTSYANAWYYLPGPIIEDGTPLTEAPEPKDTIFADVSEFQVPVDDRYPYSVISIRSNDGTYQDHKFAQNYAWCKRAADDGRLKFFIVYFYWRPNWQQAVQTHKDMINANGGPHPKMVTMIDVERGGNPAGDFSDALNATDDALSAWLGDPKRVIAYGNTGDLNGMWSNRREDQLIIAAYGSNPGYPGKIAHQYTDGNGYGGGLPEGVAPFGKCDMNSADGFTPTALAAACGITAGPVVTPPTPEGPVATKPTDPDKQTAEIYDQIRLKWEQLGWLSVVEALALILDKLLGTKNAGKTGARFDG